MSHCQTQLAVGIAVLCLPHLTHCSPWFHLAGSTEQLGQAGRMPGSPPAEISIIIAFEAFFS